MSKKLLSVGTLGALFLFAAIAVSGQWNQVITGRGTSANIAFTSKTLAANIPVALNTVQQIDSTTLAALPASCGTNGCRLRVSYSYMLVGGTQGQCWASEGANIWAQSYGATVSSNYSVCSAAGLSRSTYSAGATPTIATNAISGGAFEVCASMAGGQAAPCNAGPTNAPASSSYFEVEVVQSN